jgi:hypothetical protein
MIKMSLLKNKRFKSRRLTVKEKIKHRIRNKKAMTISIMAMRMEMRMEMRMMMRTSLKNFQKMVQTIHSVEFQRMSLEMKVWTNSLI